MRSPQHQRILNLERRNLEDSTKMRIIAEECLEEYMHYTKMYEDLDKNLGYNIYNIIGNVDTIVRSICYKNTEHLGIRFESSKAIMKLIEVTNGKYVDDNTYLSQLLKVAKNAYNNGQIIEIGSATEFYLRMLNMNPSLTNEAHINCDVIFCGKSLDKIKFTYRTALPDINKMINKCNRTLSRLGVDPKHHIRYK